MNGQSITAPLGIILLVFICLWHAIAGTSSDSGRSAPPSRGGAWNDCGGATPSEIGLFGQPPPGMVPKIFAPGIISTDACEFAITFSPDCGEIFVARRTTYESYDNRISYSRFVNGKLTPLEPAPFSSTYVETTPFVSPSGDMIYFHSERPDPVSGAAHTNDEKIWFSRKIAGHWSTPEYLPGILNTGFVMGAAVAANRTIYLCGEVNGKSGLLKSVPRNDAYADVSFVLDGLHPYIAPDESYLIYDAMEEGEKTSLYITWKTGTRQWSDGHRLPEAINKTGNECFGRMSPNGKYFFFHRNSDIYWVDAALVLSQQ